MLLIQLLDCDMSVHLTMWKKKKRKAKRKTKRSQEKGKGKEKNERKKNIEIILQPHLVNKWEYFIVDKKVLF